MTTDAVLLDTSAGTSSIPWTGLGLAGLIFLILIAGLARMGYVTVRTLTMLSIAGAAYLVGGLFLHADNSASLAQAKVASINSQLANAWPSIARTTGGLLDTSPSTNATVTVLRPSGGPCELTFRPSDTADRITAAVSCNGIPVAPQRS